MVSLSTILFVLLVDSTRSFGPTFHNKNHVPTALTSSVLYLSSSVVQEQATTTTTTTTTTDDETIILDDDMASKPLPTVKAELLDLLSTMQGTTADYRRVEAAVNRLEADYFPAQTLDFFNLLATGAWQLLFSTQLTGSPNPAAFRLRQLTQTVQPEKAAGQLVTRAVWDLSPTANAQFTCSGTLDIWHNYQITQGSRCQLTASPEKEPVLRLATGSAVPPDVPQLVSYLRRSMPAELWNATGLLADTTYLDDTLRIVRYTGGGGGGRLEGVRDIFLRQDSLARNMQQDVAAATASSK